VEGDSVSVNGQIVKLWGIDAPDLKQTCTTRQGQSYDCFTPAKNMLAGFIGQNQVTCYIRGQDRHGQKVGTCAVGDLDLAALMVRAGWALAYFDLSPQYIELEADAQARKRGLWAGKLEPPWSWRSRQNREKP
jgi:endonuclease YncB( thermonuclease family)